MTEELKKVIAIEKEITAKAGRVAEAKKTALDNGWKPSMGYRAVTADICRTLLSKEENIRKELVARDLQARGQGGEE